MKTKRISKLLGWGLSIAVVLSLGLAALPVGAQGEMEWATVTTPSWDDYVILPDSDILDYAVGSDDGSIVYAVTSPRIELAAAGNGNAEWSTLHPTAGTYSAKLTGGTQTGGDYAAVSLPGGGMLLSAVTQFVYNYYFVSAGALNGGPHMCFYTHDITDGETAEISLYSGGSGPPLGQSATAGAHTTTITGATPGFFWYGSETTFGGCTEGLPNMYTLTAFQAAGDFAANHVIDRIQIEYGWWGAGDATEPAYVDGVSINGVTCDPIEPSPMLFNSDDGGVTWTDITEELQDAANLPADFTRLTHVAVAPDDEDWLAVAGVEYVGGTPMVVASQDGGGEFSFAGDMLDTTTSTWMAVVYDLAISPEMDDIHNIAVAGINSTPAGAIFRLEAGTWLSGTWEDTSSSSYTGWDNGIADDGAGAPEFSNCVVAVDFSPNFDLDVSILCMTTAFDDADTPVNLLPYLQSGIWESSGTWNDEADFAPAVQIKDDGQELWVLPFGQRCMGFALPADYDGSDPGARNIYLYVDAYNSVDYDVGGTVVMVEDDALSPRCGPSGDPLLASIDVYGDADSCKAMVGTMIDWQNVSGSGEGDPVGFGCCEGVAVYHTVELDYCCPDWDGACKDPSGPYMAVVSYTPDGEKAYATTSGEVDWLREGGWGGTCDESAFSVSLDDGNSWNQIGLIDTDIDWISDVAVCPDCETAYISTINKDEECQVCVCDSVWRTWTKDGDIGDVWERVYHGEWSETQAQALLLRLPVDDLEDCCTLYMGIQNSNDLHYTRDCGQCWNTPPATKIAIQDVAVETENVVYVLDDAGYVSKSTQYGRRPSDEVDTDAGSGHTIFVMPDDMVIIGGNTGDSVAWSDDGGDTWTVMDDIDVDGDMHVIFDHICDDIVYAAVSGDTIYRGYMSTGEWEDLNALAYGYYGIALGRSDGTLYAASNHIGIDTTPTPPGLCNRFPGTDAYYSGVARNLTPCETDCCGTEDWDYLISGLGAGPTESFDNEPSALRICGCTTMATNTVLWAIDAGCPGYEVDPDATVFPDGALWAYEDCASKVGPTLLAPADEAVLDCDPCLTCEGIPFTLKWERMCVGCSWDIEIMDEDGNLITMTTDLVDVPITTDPPEFYIDDAAIRCGYTYTWHVRLADTETDECVHSPWSDIWSFTIAASAMDAVSLIAPDNGDMGIQISSVPFSWSSVSNADSYSFVLSPNSDLSGALASEELSGTAYEYTGSLDYLTPYYWQVTAWKDGTALSQ
ncbi:MAG: hypothetical protein IMY77_03290, partial [Chloroflexi bacterium]|nr:hypothetical protein [Chloroflexota bacterium]